MTVTFSAGLPQKCAGCALRGAALCRTVNQSDLPDVRPARLRRIGRDETFVAEGDEAGCLAVLRSGFLRKEKLRRDGRRTLLALQFPGDIVASRPRSPTSYSLEAATDAEICMFDAQTMTRMMKGDRQFLRHFMKDMAIMHERQLDMVWRRGALSSRERIIAFLVDAVESMQTEPLPDGAVIVTIALSRRDWADLSNTTVESISRTLRSLADEDLVVQESHSRYRIRDLALLARRAGIDPDIDRCTPAAPVPRQASPKPASRLMAVNASAAKGC